MAPGGSIRLPRRRDLLAAVLGAMSIGVPAAARAQKRGVVYRIGIVGLNPTRDIEGPKPSSPQVAMLLRALREMGYLYGEHYVTLAHGVRGNPLGMDGLIAALLRQKPDVIVATGAACLPLKAATASVPVVMTASL